MNGVARVKLSDYVFSRLKEWGARHVFLVTGGGAITAPIFAYPGGRRFHFTDPSGNELAVMQAD